MPLKTIRRPRFRGGIRVFAAALFLAGVSASAPAQAWAQLGSESNPLFQRWVGRNLNNRPLFLDFYGDTMLVVNDLHVTSFYHTRDSLVVYGDTSFSVRYEFRLDRMLLHLRNGGTITMSSQPLTARPIFGGTLVTWGSWVANLSNGTRILLQILRAGNTARWRQMAGGGWHQGEWDRNARTITFLWLPDSTTWVGSYDAAGHQIIFEETEPGTGVAIFRRAFFRNEEE